MHPCLKAAHAAAFAALLAASPPSHGADVAGGRDHPLVGRFAGSVMVGYAASDYDEVKLVDGPFEPGRDAPRDPGFGTAEGRAVLIYYRLPAGHATLEVLRNYEASLAARGFAKSFVCATSDGSCFAGNAPDAGYHLGAAIGPTLSLPKLDDDYVHNWFETGGRYLLARLERPEGAVDAAIWLGESPRGSVAVVRVVEERPVPTDRIVVPDAGQMERTIARDGHIDLYGILFDFDRDTLRPESRPALDQIARMLRDKPDLNLAIVGHTDDRGTPDYNMDLSRRRAVAVAEALIRDYGIAGARLSPKGRGPAAPVAPNDTEQGRAKNRRVELVAD